MSANYDRAIKELIKKRKRSKHMGTTAAITIVLLLTGIKLSSKRGYIIPCSIDIQVECSALSYDDLSKASAGEPSSVIRERVLKARQIQERRFQGHKGIHCNAQMTERMIHQYAESDESSLALLRMAMERLKLSARAYNRILKVARTIADLEGCENVQSQHIAEAIGYRNLDRGDWAERGV